MLNNKHISETTNARRLSEGKAEPSSEGMLMHSVKRSLSTSSEGKPTVFSCGRFLESEE